MNHKSCLHAIRCSYQKLTAAEKRIADHILTHGDEVTRMSIAELAGNCGTATSAVVRLAKSLGYQGYAQLKISLAVDLSKNKQLNYVPYIYPHDSAITIAEKVFSANVKALHDTAEHLDSASLEQILHCLEQAHHIYLFGVGTSASMVAELQYRLMLLGYTAFAFTDPGTMKLSTMNISKGDLAVGISYSGRTIATTQALMLARQSGAETICMTSYPNSPITDVSDHALLVYSDEVQYPVEAMSSKIAQLSMIYAITTALSAKNYTDTLERARQTKALIDTIRMEDTP